MRPYRMAGPGEHPRAGGYIVPASPAPLQRPTKLAAGMAATLRRRYAATVTEKPSEAALMLSVRGTLDPLSRWRSDLTRKPCPCCGEPDKARVGLTPGAAKARRRAIGRRHKVRPLP